MAWYKADEAPEAWAGQEWRPGTILEATAYHTNGREQGRCVLGVVQRFRETEDGAFIEFRHLGASDPYYEWWATAGPGARVKYAHLCRDSHERCAAVRDPAGKPTAVHVDVRRAVEVLPPYATASRRVLAGLPAPPFPPTRPAAEGAPPAAAAGSDGAVEVDVEERLRELGNALDHGEDPRSVEEKLTSLRARLAAHRGEAGAAAAVPPPGEVRRSAAAGERPGKRSATVAALLAGGVEADPAGRVAPPALDAGSGVLGPPGGQHPLALSMLGEDGGEGAGSRHRRLLQVHALEPGRLARELIQTMMSLVGARGLGGAGSELEPVATTFLLTVLFNLHPPKELGLRNERELRTLCLVLDLLLKGELARGMDVLAQRVKALEKSITDQHWLAARWLELIPTGQLLLVPRDEAREAAKEVEAEERSRAPSSRPAAPLRQAPAAETPRPNEGGEKRKGEENHPAQRGNPWRPWKGAKK